MEKTDKSLLEAYQQGDSTAFGELVSRYGGSVLGYLTRMCGNREQAEDFFQETFKRVCEKAHTFRGDRFKPWLFKIATHVALDGLRRHRWLRLLSRKFDCVDSNGEGAVTEVAAGNWCDPAGETIKAEQTEQVQRAIEALPMKQRSTLVLAYYQQLSYSEAATVLGCSVGTVKTQMYRALRTLAQKLPEFGGEVK